MPMKKSRFPWWVPLFWLALWQVASLCIHQEILLPSPYVTLTTLFSLLSETIFWRSILSSLGRILLGFLLAIAFGICCAIVARSFQWFRQLISPLITFTKTVPVASFIILILVWFSSRNLSIIIAFIMVFPIIYTNVLHGLENLNPALADMAKVFHLTRYATIRYVTIPQIMPFFHTACQVGLSLCFKAGIAAEVIGLPAHSIGSQLQEAKIFFDTPTLFAWTIVIIALSFATEKAYLFLMKCLCSRLY